MSDHDQSIKIVMLGESSVGKTSIVNIINSGQFIPDISPTVGACFQIKKVIHDNQLIRLNIWDTAGQERFRSLAPMFYRDADFVVLVYAINNQPSFDAIDQWYESLKFDCPVFPKVYLVGNKTDLEAERAVPTKYGQEKADAHNSVFYEVSAKADKQEILNLFLEITQKALEMCNRPRPDDNSGLNDSKSGCKC